MIKTKVRYNGIAPDTRSRKEKAKDYNAKELLVSSAPTFRVVNSLSEVRVGEIRNQDGSGSCVVQAIMKAVEMNIKKKGLPITLPKSATYAYQNRSNRPQSGSSPVEMAQFIRKNGWYTERDVPSQNMSDAMMDAIKIADNILKEKGYELNFFVDATPEFEEIAQYIEQYGNTCLLIDSDAEGYVKDIPTPKKRNHEIRHEICAVDDITLGGVKYIAIDESWNRW